MARTVSLVLALTALAFAACGDSGEEEDPTAAFLADADAICIANGEQSAERMLAADSLPADLEAQAKTAEAAIESAEEYFAQLQELQAPEELAADWEQFLDLREQTITLNQDRVDALADEDIEAAEAASSKASEVDEKENEAAAAVGLEACAEQLPADQEELARETVTETEVGGPTERVCGENVTQAYLSSVYPGDDPVAGCEKFFANEKQLADSVKIDDVQGTAGGTAVVIFEDVGGRYDGEPTLASLAYDDGIWKVHNLTPLG